MSLEAVGPVEFPSLESLIATSVEMVAPREDLRVVNELNVGAIASESVIVDALSTEPKSEISLLQTARNNVDAALDVVARQFIPEAVASAAISASGTAVQPWSIPLPKANPNTKSLFGRRAEQKVKEPSFGIRGATAEDIAAIVDIDMRSFSKVYENYGMTEEEHRADLTKKYENRFNLIGGKWMPVVTQKNAEGIDEVVGSIVCCPTSKKPEDFVSWEETTNNGMCDTLYDPEGKNVYVVSLSMDPKVKGQLGQNSLFMQQIGTMIKEGKDMAFFESRMPGLRGWVNNQCKQQGRDIDSLTEAEKDVYAKEYFGMTRERKGKEVPYDPLLRVYTGAGCDLLKVVPNAYEDVPSMNYGVLCTLDNPLKGARDSKILSAAVGGAMRLAAKSSWITRKAFG